MAGSDASLSISVIVPVYWPSPSVDRIALLRRTLKSIHDQKYPENYEVILVDDGCPTPLKTIHEKLGPTLFRRTRIVRCHRNNGLVHALNLGLASAQYGWIARLDADDQWYSGKIARQIEALRSDDDLSICATGMELVDELGRPFEKHVRSKLWSDILFFMAHVGCPFPHGSILARTDIFKLIGGYHHDVKTAHCEDHALWGIWLRFFKPTMVEDVLMKYTVSTTSVSGRHRLQQVKASEIVAQKFRDLGIVKTLPQDLESLATSLCCSLIAAGKLAYLMWRFEMAVYLPRNAMDALSRILPDRTVRSIRSGMVFQLLDLDIGLFPHPTNPANCCAAKAFQPSSASMPWEA